MRITPITEHTIEDIDLRLDRIGLALAAIEERDSITHTHMVIYDMLAIKHEELMAQLERLYTE